MDEVDEEIQLREVVSGGGDVDAEKSGSVQNASLASTVMNLSNNIIGAGILSLPWCLKEAGIVEGICLFAFVGLLSGSSMVLIAICCEQTHLFTFKDLGEHALGKCFGCILQLSMLIYTSLSCVSYLVLAGDFFSGDSGVVRGLCGAENDICAIFESRFNAVLTVTVLVLLPLSCLRNLNALRYTSFLSMLGTLYLLCMLGWNYAIQPLSGPGLNYVVPSWGTFSAAPIINIAFIAHYNVPRFYEEMKVRTIANFSLAVTIALSLCGVAYGGVALFGYLTYGADTRSDVLTNLGSESKPAIVGRLAMAAVVLFTYPLAFNALRASAFALSEYVYPLRSEDNRSFYGLTVLLIALTFVPGSLFDNIGVVLDYKGASLGGCIGFAYGAVIFLSMFAPHYVPCVPEVRTSREARVRSDEGEYEILVQDYSASGSLGEEGKHTLQLQKWKLLSFAFIAWTVVSSLLGLTVTTINLVNGNR